MACNIVSVKNIVSLNSEIVKNSKIIVEKNMKQNSRCYGCVYCQMCDKEQEEYCANENYIMFTTEQQVKMCELMGCYEVEENDCD